MSLWYYRPGHPLASVNGFVSAENLDYRDDPQAKDAPILSGRFYEDAPPATDGAPLNSRSRHRDYLRANGAAMASDYSDSFREKLKADAERADRKDRSEAVRKSWWQHTEGRRTR